MEKDSLTLSTLIPYLSGFLIFLGVSHLLQYYGGFGIDILSYLDFSEIVLSFLNILVLILGLSFFMVVYSLLFLRPLYTKLDLKPIKKRAIEKLLLRSPLLHKKIILYWKYYSWAVYWGIGIFVVMIISKTISPKTSWEQIWIIMIILASLLIYNILMHEVFIQLKIINATKATVDMVRIASFCFLIWITTLNYAYQKVKKVKLHNGLVETAIVFADGKNFHSTSSKYFIGKTNNYLFLFDEAEGRTEIFPMNEIKKITYEFVDKKSLWFLQDDVK